MDAEAVDMDHRHAACTVAELVLLVQGPTVEAPM
jgi:hypothetical protein